MEAPGHVPSVPSPKSGTAHMRVSVCIRCCDCQASVGLANLQLDITNATHMRVSVCSRC